MAFSADGRFALCAGRALLKLRCLGDGRDGADLAREEGTPGLIALSPDGRFAFVAEINGAARVLEVREGRVLWSAAASGSPVSSAAFSDDGSLLLVGRQDGSGAGWVEVVRAGDGSTRGRTRAHAGRVSSLAFAGTDSMALSGGADGRLKLWDVSSPGARARWTNCCTGVRRSSAPRSATRAGGG